MKRGLSLIEVIVGSALMLLVFLGLFEAYRLSFRMVLQTRSRVTATALAVQQMEMIKNLPYSSVGIIGGFPDGVLLSSTTTVRNGILFKVDKIVNYVVDSTDGVVPPEDECPNDYKRAQVKISWAEGFGGEMFLSTDLSPENLSQECSDEGGILSVSVFDAFGASVFSPLIEIKNPLTDEVVSFANPVLGQHYFSLATSTYKVAVSNFGFSLERTFGVGESYNGTVITNPERPHLIVIQGALTEAGFSIDDLGSFSVRALSSWGTGDFSDTFSNETKISSKSGVVVADSQVVLEPEALSGYLNSVAVSPANVSEWSEFSFSDEKPEGTGLSYQVYFATSSSWELVSEEDLPGNSAGFQSSPVDLSSLSATKYPSLRMKADFSSTESSLTPILYDWQMAWLTSDPTPIPNAEFELRGSKTVGLDNEGDAVYKYSSSLDCDSSGNKSISGMEWDNYVFSAGEGSGLYLTDVEPGPQPIGLSPGESKEVALYFDFSDSLFVNIKDSATLDPVFSASVRVYNSSLGYDETFLTNVKGQTFFVPLGSAVYNLEVSAAGYSNFNTQVTVSGEIVRNINLVQVE